MDSWECALEEREDQMEDSRAWRQKKWRDFFPQSFDLGFSSYCLSGDLDERFIFL
jgi:hypothetical protein